MEKERSDNCLIDSTPVLKKHAKETKSHTAIPTTRALLQVQASVTEFSVRYWEEVYSILNHGRGRMTTDLRIHTMPARSMSGFH